MELSLLLQMSESDLVIRLDHLVETVHENTLAIAFESRHLRFDNMWATRVHMLDHDDLAILVRDIERLTAVAQVLEVEPLAGESELHPDTEAESGGQRKDSIQFIRKYYPLLSSDAKRRVLDYTDISYSEDVQPVACHVERYLFDEPVYVIAKRIDDELRAKSVPDHLA